MSIFDNQDYLQIIERVNTDVTSNLPDVDPRIFASFIRTLAVSNGGRHYDNVLLLKRILKLIFPQTTDEAGIRKLMEYEGLSPIVPTESTGKIIIGGDVGTTIAAGNEFETENGIRIRSLTETTCQLNIINVIEITRVGQVATVTTEQEHDFASGLTVTISGADQSEYNGDFVITVIGSLTFTYLVSGSPATPATGAITAEYDGVDIPVESVEYSRESNLDSGTPVKSVFFISGLDEYGYVDFLGLTGGSQGESLDDQKKRLFSARAKPFANFNVGAIDRQAKTVPEVTRVFVKPITPYIGAVEVFFTRDNFQNPIPDSGEIQKVKNALLEILPVTSSAGDVYVLPPVLKIQDFVFTSLIPSTPELQETIINNLTDFFKTVGTFETNITEDQYRAAIVNSIDPVTGEQPSDFELSDPVGPIVVGLHEVPKLGNVLFTG